MTDAERIQALLNIVDPSRDENASETAQLLALGLAARRNRGAWPTSAGWYLMGEPGRPFDPLNTGKNR